MTMPGRSFTASKAYRYGFNGKENDKDAHTNTWQDYGFRIYNPALGRFLSVDPLTKSYPGLTPYQYASNNPVEGIDLDGLEYVSSKEVRIEIVYGKVKLKIENMTSVVRNSLKAANEDPANWPENSIGIDFTIGSFSLEKAAPKEGEFLNGLDNTSGAPDPNFKAGQTKVENPIAKSTGKPDRRYKDRTVSSASPGGSKGLAILSVAIDAVIFGRNIYVKNRIAEDKSMINEHVNKFKLAAADVNYALNNTTLIGKEYQDIESLSDIINYVLAGESRVNSWDKTKGKKIIEIGQKIISEVSSKRVRVLSITYESVKVGEKFIQVAKETLNPKYDVEYIKNNTPSNDTPKK
jgi:RHS repeat-associated protein